MTKGLGAKAVSSSHRGDEDHDQASEDAHVYILGPECHTGMTDHARVGLGLSLSLSLETEAWTAYGLRPQA